MGSSRERPVTGERKGEVLGAQPSRPAQGAHSPQRWLLGSGKGQGWLAPGSKPLLSPGPEGLSLLLLSSGLSPLMPPRLAGPGTRSPVVASLARCPAVRGELRPAVVGQGGACLPPCLGYVGSYGGQWFLHFSGETGIFQALDLRACQAVGTLRPFLCPAPGAWGQHAWSLEPPIASRL